MKEREEFSMKFKENKLVGGGAIVKNPLIIKILA